MRKIALVALLGWYFIIAKDYALEVGPFKSQVECQKAEMQARRAFSSYGAPFIVSCYERYGR